MSRRDQGLEAAYLATRAVGTTASDVAVRSPDALAWRDSDWFKDLQPSGMVLALDRRPLRAALEALDEVFKDCREPNWNGYGARPVSVLTYLKAREFIMNLPSAVGEPEVAADPDGELALEWFGGRNRILSISISLNGRLTYVYRNGSTRLRGTLWYLDDEVPVEVIKLLEALRR